MPSEIYSDCDCIGTAYTCMNAWQETFNSIYNICLSLFYFFIFIFLSFLATINVGLCLTSSYLGTIWHIINKHKKNYNHCNSKLKITPITYIEINTWPFPYQLGYHPEIPHISPRRSRGMIAGMIWKRSCINCFIIYFPQIVLRNK